MGRFQSACGASCLLGGAIGGPTRAFCRGASVWRGYSTGAALPSSYIAPGDYQRSLERIIAAHLKWTVVILRNITFRRRWGIAIAVAAAVATAGFAAYLVVGYLMNTPSDVHARQFGATNEAYMSSITGIVSDFDEGHLTCKLDVSSDYESDYGDELTLSLSGRDQFDAVRQKVGVGDMVTVYFQPCDASSGQIKPYDINRYVDYANSEPTDFTRPFPN